MTTRRLAPLTLALALAAGACDASTGKDALDTSVADTTLGPVLSRVETSVSADTVESGASVTVTCAALDQDDATYPTSELAFSVADASGQIAGADIVTVAGDVVTFTRAGAYRIRCAYTGNNRVEDASPAVVTVTAGAATSLRTSLLRTSLTAGDSVTVICTVQDAAGNAAAADSVVRVTPDHGVTTTDKRVRFIRPGSFEVVCALADGSLVADPPVAVDVSAGAVALLRTTLSATEVGPDEHVTVTCPGEDAFGNPATLDAGTIALGEGLERDPATKLEVWTTRSGTYQVDCAPAEAWVEATSIPAELAVLPGAPASLTLDLTPDRAVYNLNSRVRLTPRLVDAWGNPLAQYEGALDTTASLDGEIRQVVAPDDKVKFDAEGVWHLEVAAASLSATRDVPVDASSPAIAVTWPARGQMIIDDGGTLVVQGSVTDATGGLAEVRINGSPQLLSGAPNEYVIAYPMSARHGLNTLLIEATDTNGNQTRAAQSFIVSTGYKLPHEAFEDGIIAHLDDDFLDDGARGPAIDDLTTIFSRVFNAMDIGAFLPSPAVTYGGYDVYLRDLTYDEPELALDPSLGAINLDLRIADIDVEVDAQGFIDVGGDVSIDAVDMDMQLLVSIGPSGPRVEAGVTEVTVSGLDIDVHWSINWLINFFEKRVSDSIADSFKGALMERLPAQVEQALGAFAISEIFEIPALLPGMQPINVTVEARPSDVHLTTGGMDLDLSASVSTLKRIPWSAPGSILRGDCFGTEGGVPVWQPDQRLGFALSADVLNQLLFAVWWGGALEIDLDADAFADADLSEYGVSDLTVTLSGHMPPIVTDCLDQRLYLQLGELAVDASLTLGTMPIDLGMIIAFETTADVSLDDTGAFGLALGDIDPDEVLIDIVSVDSELFDEDDEDVLITLLRDQLLTKLLQNLTGQSLAGFPLPSIDLGALDPSLAGQAITMGELTLARDRGFLRLEGHAVVE